VGGWRSSRGPEELRNGPRLTTAGARPLFSKSVIARPIHVAVSPRQVMPDVRLLDVVESGGNRPEGSNTMLWILALPVVAVIAMLAYVLGYRSGKKVGMERARREYEAWREMRYCGTALLHMKEAANEARQREGKLTMHGLRVAPDVKLPPPD